MLQVYMTSSGKGEEDYNLSCESGLNRTYKMFLEKHFTLRNDK